MKKKRRGYTSTKTAKREPLANFIPLSPHTSEPNILSSFLTPQVIRIEPTKADLVTTIKTLVKILK